MSNPAPTANDLFHAAQDLIRQGQPVFPCRAAAGEKTKAPHTRNGLHDASTDLKQVKQWWRQFRNAAIGIPTGILHDVLDVDIKGDAENPVDGRVHLPYLTRLGLLNGCEKVVKTPSGGWHLYFPASPTLRNKGRAASLGLDVRATGGYVIAAPSYIETPDYQGVYTDLGDTTGSTGEPLYWDLIISALVPLNNADNKPVPLLRVERRANVASLRQWLAEREHGERNNALHWAVCRCIDNGIDPHEMVEPALLIGLGEEEVLVTVRAALKRAGLTADDLDTEAEAMFPEAV
jgi:hypothetical protein